MPFRTGMYDTAGMPAQSGAVNNSVGWQKESCIGASANQGLGITQSYISIDASKSNALFGDTTTVQTASMRVQCLIRYAV